MLTIHAPLALFLALLPMCRQVCNHLQAFTQHGGLRPFGVVLVVAGWDKERGFQVHVHVLQCEALVPRSWTHVCVGASAYICALVDARVRGRGCVHMCARVRGVWNFGDLIPHVCVCVCVCVCARVQGSVPDMHTRTHTRICKNTTAQANTRVRRNTNPLLWHKP